jgi:uroporphyrinogen-III decarboxylase
MGDDTSITETVASAKGAGADAIWPGCDLVPQTPVKNIKAMMDIL